jgi:hypothetical protein
MATWSVGTTLLRSSVTPTMPPRAMAPTCAHAVGMARAMIAATTASVARSLSGASERAMPSTA